jgi:hypothetical protein
MPTYSVGTAPQAIGQGFQDAATIYNKGPDIVWLDSNTSVTPTSGYAVYPGDSISWQSGKKIYAVARQLLPYSQTDMPNQTGRAEVQVTTDASILVPNSERTELLYTFADPFTNQGPLQRVNVARYQAVQVMYYKPSVRSDALPDYIDISLLWHDADGNVIDDSVYHGAMGPFTNVLTVPVRGVYVSVSVTASDGSTNAEIPLERLRLVGSTLPLPLSWKFTPFLWYRNTSGVVGDGVIHGHETDYGVMWGSTDLSTAAPNVHTSTRIYLPCVTSRYHYFLQTSAGMTTLRSQSYSNPTGTVEVMRDYSDWPVSGSQSAKFDLATDQTAISYVRPSGTIAPTGQTFTTISVIYQP